MAPSSDAGPLPKYLRNAWQFNQRGTLQDFERDRHEVSKWTVSSLCEQHLKDLTASYDEQLEQQEQEYNGIGRDPSLDGTGAASLTSVCVGKIIDDIESSNDLTGCVQHYVTNLEFPCILHILRDPRTPYLILRTFLNKTSKITSDDINYSVRPFIDIDEVVLANERYLRSRGPERNKDGKGLVTLQDVKTLFDLTDGALKPDRPVIITRKDPPKGGLEFLDTDRPRKLALHHDTDAFIRTFHRITNNILNGLDWKNVFVAGGMALATLHAVDDPMKSLWAHDSEVNCDIDIYLYALNPQQANDKVREIYQVWSTNLPVDNKQKLVIKNAKTINFLADYPNRRVQIILKLVKSPMQILLNFDLDPCAVGFTGTEVLMLPRCARALETGYSTFTMDLIWGHHLRDRRATQELRVFKYANRGFGIRILPCYIRVLEEDTQVLYPPPDALGEKENADEDNSIRRSRIVEYKHKGINRKPHGKEPGLKTLKRIEYLGKLMVRRFCLEDPEGMQRPQDWFKDEESWRTLVEELRIKDAERVEENASVRAQGRSRVLPLIAMSGLDGKSQHRDLPDGRKGLGSFELWMRHCEVWRLDANCEATLDRGSLSSTIYDEDGYDDTPSYTWNEEFDAESLVRAIKESNNGLFETLKESISTHLGLGFVQRRGWRYYLTRFIKRQVYGPDLDSVMGKQIVVPVMIPFDLQQTLEQYISEALKKANVSNVGNSQVLVPVHGTGNGTTILPDLQITAAESGNPVFWIIDNDLMWAGIDRRIDEVFEILWTLFHWHNINAPGVRNPHVPGVRLRLDSERTTLYMADRFRRRLSNFIDTEEPSISPLRANGPTYGNIPEREAELFRCWVLQRPNPTSREYFGEARIKLTDDEIVDYPFDDTLFWKDGDEGVHHGAAEWIEVDEESDDEVDGGAEGEVQIGMENGSLREIPLPGRSPIKEKKRKRQDSRA
ncbi:MAG: hypothetical protein M1827_002221 [Pycnora praestabilis]|nr:MAG: hypothetical protein M1827_002221 [Pycnora praestabilis]